MYNKICKCGRKYFSLRYRTCDECREKIASKKRKKKFYIKNKKKAKTFADYVKESNFNLGIKIEKQLTSISKS